jgi:hypothetical protein
MRLDILEPILEILHKVPVDRVQLSAARKRARKSLRALDRKQELIEMTMAASAKLKRERRERELESERSDRAGDREPDGRLGED